MERKNYNKRKRRGNADHPDTAFPRRKYTSIDSVGSYAVRRQGSTDENTLFDAYSRNKRTTKDNMRSTGSIDTPRFSTDDGFDTTSFTSRKTGRSLSKRFRRKNADKYDVNQHYYAGIAHSDLDIQTGRPPLLFQMNIVEWLWFQSGTTQRVMFMGLGALFFLFLSQLIFGIYLVFAPHESHDPYLCHSERCNDLSRRLRKTLNKSVDPCEDFYGFVCGSSDTVHNLSEEDNKRWNFGFDVQRVVYDFRYSTTLGRMLKKTRKNPEHLVLDLYQACLEKRKRNKLELLPYYQVLKEFGLYNVGINASLQSSDVAISMGKILGHSFLTSAVLKVQLYRKDARSPLHAYIEQAITEPLRTGPTFRFGYKRYYTAIHTAFSVMRDELQVTDTELSVLPHDIICLELYFRDMYTPERMKYVIDDPDNIGSKPCELDTFSGTIQANYGQNPAGPFDFDLLIRTMFSVSNPNWNPKSPKNPFGDDFNDPKKDPRTDTKFLERFEKDFEKSAPIRFMRYLQWRVLFATSTHLSDSVDDFMLPIKRHQNLGYITNCFHAVFTYLPFLSPHTFLKNSNTEIKKIIQRFDLTAKHTFNMYSRRASKSIVEHMASILNKKFTDREALIINRILLVDLRVDSVHPIKFQDENFKNFRKLYADIKFDYDHHLDNLLKMGHRIHEWKTNPDYSDIYYNIKSDYRLPILFDRSRTNYDLVENRYRIYLPMAVAESPFSNDGLYVSDISGLGLEFAGNLEKTFYMSLVYEASKNYLHTQFNTSEFQGLPPVTVQEVDSAESNILDFYGTLKQKFKDQITKYKFGGKLWNNIKYESAMDQILTTALQDQSRYHAISLVVNDFLRDPSTTWHEKKAVLYGLEKYNVKQIFYMSLVNRRCDKIGPLKFAQIYEYGPLPQPIIENLALSNLIDFAETFNCPIGSPMNRKEKIYFWNQDFDVKKDRDLVLVDPGIL